MKKLLSTFSSLSKENKRSVSKFLAICYGNVIDDNTIMKQNKEVLLLMLLYYNLIDENKKQTFYYKILSILTDSNNYKFYDEDDYVILEKQNINRNIFGSIEPIYQCHVGEDINIIPPVHGFCSCFKCELPEGLSIDYYSGIITGRVKEEAKGEFTIYYRNPSKTSFSIRLIITNNSESKTSSITTPSPPTSTSSLFGNKSSSTTSTAPPPPTSSGLFGNKPLLTTLSFANSSSSSTQPKSKHKINIKSS